MSKRRLVYAGGDMFSSVLASCLELPDLEVVLCLTGQGQHRVSSLARNAGVPLRYGAITDEVVQAITRFSPAIFLSAAYPHIVPVAALNTPYTLNLHPTLLPHGRGRFPLPHLVAGHQHFAGLTLHEMDETFDTGPILASQSIDVPLDWGYNELLTALSVLSPRFVAKHLTNIDTLFPSRLPQSHGSYWQTPSRAERTVNWNHPIESAKEQSRIFGQSGIFCAIDHFDILVKAPINCIALCHHYPAGAVIADDARFWYMAAVNGVARIPKFFSGHVSGLKQ